MEIPIFDLKRQYQAIKPEIDEAVERVLTNGFFTLGPQVALFEEEFSAYLSKKRIYAAGVSSGTDALTLAIRALGLGKGDEVILPANSYPTVFGVALSGVTIRLADCGEDGNMTPESLSRVMRKKTKAVVCVHLYGNPADVIGICSVAKAINPDCFIIEDAAQAHGAEIGSKKQEAGSWNNEKKKYLSKSHASYFMLHASNKVGTIGDIGCFSFYPTKNLGAYGDGGLVVTRDKHALVQLRKFRMYGERTRYHSEEVAGVSRLDELQAGILRVKLRHLDEWNEKRRRIAQYYERELEETGDITFMKQEAGSRKRKKNTSITKIHDSDFMLHTSRSCYHLFVIRTKKRDALLTHLLDRGIGCAIHYPVPIHLAPSMTYLGYTKGDFPSAESLSREALSLPLYPELTDNEIDHVCRQVKSFFS